MSHMVIYRSVEGSPVFHQVESLEDAARHVETLRNAGQGADARIFSMKEVKIEVKTYYRVEVASVEEKPAPVAPVQAAVAPPAPSAPAPVAPVAEVATPAPAPVAAAASAPSAAPAAVKPEPAVAAAAANGGRFGLFGKG